MGSPFIIYRTVDVTDVVDTVVNELNKNGIACELEPADTETSATHDSYSIRLQKTWARMTFTISKSAVPGSTNTIGIDISNKSGYRPIGKRSNISIQCNVGGSTSNLSLSILKNSDDFWLFNIYISNTSLSGPNFLGTSNTEITIGRVQVKKGDKTTSEFICSTGITSSFFMFKNIDTEREYELNTGDATIINAMYRYTYVPQEGWDLLALPAVSFAYGSEGTTFTTIESVELPGLRTVWGSGVPYQRPLSINGDTWYRLSSASYLAVKLYPE